MTEPRILSITPRHPNRQQGETQVTHPSCVSILIDTGLKSGKLTEVRLDIAGSVEMTAKLATATQQAFHAREGMAS